jgi:phosphatidylglycerophosphate synthase
LTYQPIGKLWAFPLAERLAEWLRPTPIRPNAVTAASAILMLAAAALVAAGVAGPAAAAGIAAALAMALVLDTADGRLARLQGTSSAFGRWLDEFLDEMVDLALHAAIAWSAFVRDGRPIWLLLGIAYASGKYLFRVQSSLGDELLRHTNALHLPAPSLLRATRARARGIAEYVRLLGHADVRWHLWIVLAAMRRLDLALIAYAIYFPARTLAGAIRKGWRHA